jgi:hypothetical protein
MAEIFDWPANYLPYWWIFWMPLSIIFLALGRRDLRRTGQELKTDWFSIFGSISSLMVFLPLFQIAYQAAPEMMTIFFKIGGIIFSVVLLMIGLSIRASTKKK